MDLRRQIWIAAAFAAVGRYSMVWLAVAILGVVLSGDPAGFAVFAGALVIEWALTNGPVKMLFTRARPDNSAIAEHIPSWLHPPRSSSFPSGHSSSAAFSTVLLWAWNPAAGVIAALFSLAMATSRVVIRAHHRSDVLAGLAWGVLLAALALVVAGDSFMS